MAASLLLLDQPVELLRRFVGQREGGGQAFTSLSTTATRLPAIVNPRADDRDLGAPRSRELPELGCWTAAATSPRCSRYRRSVDLRVAFTRRLRAQRTSRWGSVRSPLAGTTIPGCALHSFFTRGGVSATVCPCPSAWVQALPPFAATLRVGVGATRSAPKSVVHCTTVSATPYRARSHRRGSGRRPVARSCDGPPRRACRMELAGPAMVRGPTRQMIQGFQQQTEPARDGSHGGNALRGFGRRSCPAERIEIRRRRMEH